MKKHTSRILCSLLFFLSAQLAQAQPVSIKWYPQVKTSKDQRTLLLLNAGESGFHLLRWQDSRTDAQGNRTPAMPLLTVLTPSGERLHDDPIPGFESGALDFRFATATDSVLLVVYEATNSTGTQSLFARRLNLFNRKWSAEAQVLFTDVSNRAPAFARAWFSRSVSGSRTCVYRMDGGQAPKIALAVFDEDLRLLWQRTVELPKTSGQQTMRQVLCTDSGAVALHCQIFNPGNHTKGQPYETAPTVYNADGRALYRAPEWAVEASPYSDAVFVLQPGQGPFADFYPKLGMDFTPSFELVEGPDGRIYCSGFYNTDDNEAAEGYFVYAIDPAKQTGELLKQATFPGSMRTAFLHKKAAENKEAVPGLALRWLRWAADGTPWMLAEQQNFDIGSGRIESAALLRLDSSFRMTATRKVEKYQNLKPGDAQNFASVAAVPSPKNGWWLLWNTGSWPNTKLILTETGVRGTPADYTIDSASKSNVSLLPQTLLYRNGAWYFVGESEYHERIRIGRLE